MKIAVMASGKGSNLQAIIDAEKDGRIDGRVVLVISDNSDAYALERAKKHGIVAYHLSPSAYNKREEYDQEVVRLLQKHGINLVCLAGFMRLISPYFVEKFRNRIMNLHPSLLPSFPGTSGCEDAFKYGVKVTGCTVHFVDEGLDTGPIILQKAVEVREKDTVDTLQERIHSAEHEIYPQAIQLFCRNKISLEGRKCIIND